MENLENKINTKLDADVYYDFNFEDSINSAINKRMANFEFKIDKDIEKMTLQI